MPLHVSHHIRTRRHPDSTKGTPKKSTTHLLWINEVAMVNYICKGSSSAAYEREISTSPTALLDVTSSLCTKPVSYYQSLWYYIFAQPTCIPHHPSHEQATQLAHSTCITSAHHLPCFVVVQPTHHITHPAVHLHLAHPRLTTCPALL